MVKMCDKLLVEVGVDRSRREIVTENKIRIAKETQLYGQHIERCILKPRCDI